MAFKIPGVAVAIVKGGKVVFSKGFGYRDITSQKPVTPSTLFAIGSNSKAFTATDIAMLVGQGALSFDNSVREFLPTFHLKDEYATSHVTLRDMLSHRTGLPRHDLTWYCSSATREDLLRRLQFLPASKELRQEFQYNNLMVMTAGYVAGRIRNTSWENVTSDLILKPLKMTASNFSVADLQLSEDYATPYSADVHGDPIKVAPRNIDAVGPAGSINSNLNDMTKWLMFHLSGGKDVNGLQLVRKDTLKETHTPQIVIPIPPPFSELSTGTYGLGWGSFYYRGHRLIWHNGGIDGYLSYVGFLPDDDIGVVVLTNGEQEAYQMIPLEIFDEELGLSSIDWLQRFKDHGQNAPTAAKLETVVDGTPARPFKDYTGSYFDPGYGTLAIEEVGTELHLKFNCFDVDLTRVRSNAFVAKFPASTDLGDATAVTFGENTAGNIASVVIPFEPSVAGIRFVKRMAQ